MKNRDTCIKTDTGLPEDLLSRPFLLNLVGFANLVGAEIGVRFGCNAFRMLHNLEIDLLYLIDIKQTREANNNLEGFNNIRWLVGSSHTVNTKIKDGELDFVYIDGNHHYNHVLRDIELYTPKVKVGGYIAGHDYKDGGLGVQVKKAVHEVFGDAVETSDNDAYWDWWHKKV